MPGVTEIVTAPAAATPPATATSKYPVWNADHPPPRQPLPLRRRTAQPRKRLGRAVDVLCCLAAPEHEEAIARSARRPGDAGCVMHTRRRRTCAGWTF